MRTVAKLEMIATFVVTKIPPQVRLGDAGAD
jgi:hypothetical protein